MVYESREKLIETIKTRFSDRYTVLYKPGENIISISKNSVYPICVDIGIKLEVLKHHINPYKYYPYLKEEYIINDNEFYELEFLDMVQYILNNLEENVNMFYNFAQDITEYFDDTVYSYLVNMDNIYIKNFRTRKFINICPVKDLSKFNNDSFLELSVKYIEPVIDKKLMTIYVPAANISDTWDALCMFLN